MVMTSGHRTLNVCVCVCVCLSLCERESLCGIGDSLQSLPPKRPPGSQTDPCLARGMGAEQPGPITLEEAVVPPGCSGRRGCTP